MRDITPEETEYVDRTVAPYRAQVSATPALLSLLYDLDLLPEQIKLGVNASRMACICELFKVLTPEQIGSLFRSDDAVVSAGETSHKRGEP